MNLDEFRSTFAEFKRTYYPHVKDLKAKGEMVLLCGVSDGRGKVCGRSVDGRTVTVMDSADAVIAMCPKHRGVVCSADKFRAALRYKSTVYFHAPAQIAHRTSAS